MLTPNFSLTELTSSAKARQLGIDNQPDADTIAKLKSTALMLERVREALGAPVVVTSGYRCERLNKAVGGVSTSDHVSGQAADIISPAFGSPYDIAKKLSPQVKDLGVGQLILESAGGKQWVHVSRRVPSKSINQILTYSDRAYRTGIHQV